MKLINLIEKHNYKYVVYVDITLTVPDWVKYIAIDKDGAMCGYSGKPSPCNILDKWTPNYRYVQLGRVDLEGMDWRETLIEV